jgi:ABC-2 type transport system ATP-binding protein
VTAPIICVEQLSKTYRVPARPPGLRAALASLLHRTVQEVPAVRGVSFAVAPGEVVGFIGPNGAGKTTTLKMLTGLLQPSAGTVQVAGFTPGARRPEYLRRIALVMGNKSQLLWDIPPLDTFRVLGEIYGVPPAVRQAAVDELVALLGLEGLLQTSVRNLSLGERMKCELVASLLHRPQVLFLDEPTLGLDVSAQRRLRSFIGEYNRRTGATILLTSHYMADVVELCPRVILIQEGRLLYDGALGELSARLAPFKLLRLTLDGAHPGSSALRGSDPRGWDPGSLDLGSPDPGDSALGRPAGAHLPAGLPAGADLLHAEHGSMTLRVPRAATAAITASLLNTLPVVDLAVEDPPIEAVIDQIYAGGAL